MIKRIAALVVALSAIGLFAAVPATAQQPANVTGDFECTEPGVFTVFWTIENFAGADGEVESAILSGAAEGDITDSFEPNPFTGDDELIVGSSEVSGDTVGIVTLEVLIIFEFKGPFEFQDLAERIDPESGRPLEPTESAWVPFDALDSDLTRCIRTEKRFEVLRPFLDIPAKENGFDIEGVAARAERVFIGLRGPVLRGWAGILDLEAGAGARIEIGRLEMHLLHLGGLGVRDLEIDGEDLLILSSRDVLAVVK